MNKSMQLFKYTSMQVYIFKYASMKNSLQNLFAFHPIFYLAILIFQLTCKGRVGRIMETQLLSFEP